MENLEGQIKKLQSLFEQRHQIDEQIASCLNNDAKIGGKKASFISKQRKEKKTAKKTGFNLAGEVLNIMQGEFSDKEFSGSDIKKKLEEKFPEHNFNIAQIMTPIYYKIKRKTLIESVPKKRGIFRLKETNPQIAESSSPALNVNQQENESTKPSDAPTL